MLRIKNKHNPQNRISPLPKSRINQTEIAAAYKTWISPFNAFARIKTHSGYIKSECHCQSYGKFMNQASITFKELLLNFINRSFESG